MNPATVAVRLSLRYPRPAVSLSWTNLAFSNEVRINEMKSFRECRCRRAMVLVLQI